MIQDGDNFSESICEEEISHDYALNRQDKLVDKLSKIQKERTLIHDDINFYESITSKNFKRLKENYGAEIAEEVIFFASLLNKARDAQSQDLISNINRDFGLELNLEFEYEDFSLGNDVLPNIYLGSESITNDDYLSDQEQAKKEAFWQNISLYLRDIDINYGNLCSKYLEKASENELNALLDLKDYLNYIKISALEESEANLREIIKQDQEKLFTLDEVIDNFIRFKTNHYQNYLCTKMSRILEILESINSDTDSNMLLKSIEISSNKIHTLILNGNNSSEEVEEVFTERNTFLGFYTNHHQVKFYKTLKLIHESSVYPEELQVKFVSLYRDIIKHKIGLKKYIENKIKRNFDRQLQMREVLDPLESLDLFLNIDREISVDESYRLNQNEYRDYFKVLVSSQEYFLLGELLELCLNSIATDFYEINNYAKEYLGHEIINLIGEIDKNFYANYSLIKNFELKDKLISKNYTNNFRSLKKILEESVDEKALEALWLLQSINRYYECSSLNRANQDIFERYGSGDLSPIKEEIGFYALIDLLILNLPSEITKTQTKIYSLLEDSDIEIKQNFAKLIEASKELSSISKLSPYYKLLKNYSIMDSKIAS